MSSEKVGCTGGLQILLSMLALLLAAWLWIPNDFNFGRFSTYINKYIRQSPTQVWGSAILLPPSTQRNGEREILLLHSQVTASPVTEVIKKVYQTPDDGLLPILLTHKKAAQYEIAWQEPLRYANVHQLAGLRVAGSADALFIIADRKLQSIRRTDGSQVWELNLSQSIDPACTQCFTLERETLFVLTQDGALKAFNINTGQVQWQQQIQHTPAAKQGFELVKNTLAFQDIREGKTTVFFHYIGDGSLARAITPALPKGKAATLYQWLFDPFKDFVYLIDSQDEIQEISCWRIIGTKQQWEAKLPAKSRVRTFHRYTSVLAAVVQERFLYVGVEMEGRHALLRFNARNGQMMQLAESDTYGLVPLQEVSGMLLVKARHLQNDSYGQLWCLNVQNGQRIWNYALDANNYVRANAPISEQPEGLKWSFQSVGGFLYVLQEGPEKGQVKLQKLDWRSGQALNTYTGMISSNEQQKEWLGVLWLPDRVLITFQRLYSLELEGGKWEASWP
ncbi:PQQ-binding-like beta-propeller repeat protein [Eisenibacter elegans]|uniref:outer membrane protein assembly factor BamB family protein n=1 Tax=Eisenibacter elegans TaxID=997 RepID=UPI00041CB394|nr:PQQ-binding-like beta-propeller repeat protein [Eisenibacter elegans]